MPDAPSSTPQPNAWVRQAIPLADWAIARLQNRTNRCGGYFVKEVDGEQVVKRTTRLAEPPKDGWNDAHVFVTKGDVRQHFRGAKTAHILGFHALGPGSVGKWLGIDIDAHDDAGTPADPEANLRYALHLYDVLTRLGFRVLLYESNGRGGYHLLVLFDAAVGGEVLFAFGNWLAREYRAFGFTKPPEVFPKQKKLVTTGETGRWGNWLRLIGRHHSRDFWPRVWNGRAWFDNDDAVEHVLSLPGDPGSLIPAEAKGFRPATDRGTTGTHAGGAAQPATDDDIFAEYNRGQTIQSVSALLRTHSWKDAGTRGDRVDFYRPNKKGGGSASGNLKVIGGVPIFFGFTTATDVPESTGHSPSRLRAILEYSGDFARLAQRLREEGYGGGVQAVPKIKFNGKPVSPLPASTPGGSDRRSL